jgi:2-phosphosulfolactate phosphatase
MSNTVVIDCFPERVGRWRDGYAVVAVDVVRATTTAVTAVATGRRCFPVGSLDEAFALAAVLDDPLLVGEVRGIMPQGFDINNSPAALAARTDIHRPAILLSSTGTRLCQAAGQCIAAFPACLRNYVAVARHLAQNFPKVAVIGAGTRDEFREEDQMCCAWIADRLLDFGYDPKDQPTAALIERWRGARADAWVGGNSAAYLRRSGQLEDLDFILGHVNDLRAVYSLRNGEVIAEPSAVAETRKKELLNA